MFATTVANTPDKKATFATTGENTPDKKVTFAPNGENAPNLKVTFAPNSESPTPALPSWGGRVKEWYFVMEIK